MLELYLDFTRYAVYLSVFLSVIGILIYVRLNSALKIFAIFLIVSGAFEHLAYAISKVQRNNLEWVHLYTLMEIVILSGFFHSVFARMNLKYPIKNVTGVVLILCISNTIYLQPLDSFNSYAATLVSLTLIAYCILTFYHLLDKDNDEYKKIRWLVSGLLLYQMTSFIVMAFSNVLNQLEMEVDMIVWLIRIIVMLITKVMFGAILLLAAFPKSKKTLYG